MKSAIIVGLGLLVFASPAFADTKRPAYTPPPSRAAEHRQEDNKRQDRQADQRRQDTHREQQNQVTKDSLKKKK